MKFGIVIFPGSNCDHDAYYALKYNLKQDTVFLWHKERKIPNDIDCIVLPGGFSYGDYLRSGAIAHYSPIMQEVCEFAEKGKFVIGICNGFQILTEAGLLPGALLKNKNLTFLCKDTYLKTMNFDTAFTNSVPKEKILRIPIAHFEGNYFAEPSVIEELEQEKRILFKYSSPEGIINEEFNPNGSMNNIAGIMNKKGNVLGMMPHPERYCDPILKCTDGTFIFQSLINYFHH